MALSAEQKQANVDRLLAQKNASLAQGVGTPNTTQQAKIAELTANNKASQQGVGSPTDAQKKMIADLTAKNQATPKAPTAPTAPTEPPATTETPEEKRLTNMEKTMADLNEKTAKQQEELKKSFADLTQSNKSQIESISKDFSSMISDLGVKLSDWQSTTGKIVDTQNQDYRKNLQDLTTQRNQGIISNEEFQKGFEKLNNTYSKTEEKKPITEPLNGTIPVTDGNTIVAINPITGEELTDDQIKKSFFSGVSTYEGMMNLINESGLELEDLDSGQLMLLKVNSMQGALNDKIYNDLTAQAQKQSDYIKSQKDVMTNFLNSQKEIASQIADNTKQVELDEIAQKELELTAERDATVAELEQKSLRFEAYAKSKMLYSGVSMDGSGGLFMLSEMTSNFFGQIASTKAQYASALASLHNSETKVKMNYTNSILKLESDYTGNVLSLQSQADEKILGIQSDLLKTQTEIDSSTFQTMADTVLKIQELDTKKKAKADELAAQARKEALDLMKFHTEQSGYFYTIGEDGNVDLATDENGNAFPTLNRLKEENDFTLAQGQMALDEWYKGAQVQIANAGLTLDKQKIALDALKFNWEKEKFILENEGQTDSNLDNLLYSSAIGYESIGNGKITQKYGGTLTGETTLLANGQRGHAAVDIDGKTGDPIYSTVSGEVVRAAYDMDLGNFVVVKDAEGNQHYFSHLSKKVDEGTKIAVGQTIGLMGNSGRVFDMNGNPPSANDTETGSHLDYRVKSADGKWIDPSNFLNRDEKVRQHITNDAFIFGGLTAKAQEAMYKKYQGYGLDSEFQNVIMGNYDNLLGDNAKYTNAMQQLLPDNDYKTNKITETAKYLAEGNVDKAKSSVFSALINKLPMAEQTIMQSDIRILNEVSTLKEAFSKYKSLTGFEAGTSEQVANYFGNTTNRNLAGLSEQKNLILQKYTKSQSGAAFSAQEFDRYEELFPSLKKNWVLNETQLDSFYNTLKGIADNKVNITSNFLLESVEDVIPESQWVRYGITSPSSTTSDDEDLLSI